MTLDLTPQDLLIYLSIKRFMNSETKEAFPSLSKISEVSGASIPTIRKCIDNLTESGYLYVYKKGRSNIYRFLKWDKFESFSYEFLDNKDLTFTEKAYLVASQQYMYTDVEDYGKISLSNAELSSLINMPEKTIYKCDKSLEKKNLLNIVKTSKHDSETGIAVREKIYHLTEVEQGIIWVLKNHKQQIDKNTADIQTLLQEREEQKKEVANLTKLVKQLLKQVNSEDVESFNIF
jgi:hypothetical protein